MDRRQELKPSLSIALLSFSVTIALADRLPRLKFLSSTDLPNIGLRVMLLSDAAETPLPPPSTHQYTFTQGEKTWKSDMHDPFELWEQTQHAGKWVDPHGNSMVIASITCEMPNGFSAEHVTREDFDAKLATCRKAPGDWTPELMKQWVSDFTRAQVSKAEILKLPSLQMKQLIRFRVVGDPHKLAYAFMLRPRSARRYKAPTNWFLLLIDTTPQIDPVAADRALMESFFKNLSASRTKKSADVAASSKFQRKTSRKTEERSSEFEESRALVANSILNMKNWWYVNTENYIFLSDLGVRHRVLVNDLQHDIEYLRAAYEQFIPPREAITAVSVIRIFAMPEEYVAYVGESHKWSGGLWMPNKKEMIIKPFDGGRSKQDQRANVKRVMYHEAFHQYIAYAMPGCRSSVWFNEGHAGFFENAEIAYDRLEIEEDKQKLPLLSKMMESGHVDVKRMLSMSYEEFYAGSDEQRQENYCLAWAMVYYLRKGAPVEKPARNAGIMDAYCGALWESRDGNRATEAAFAGTTYEQFLNDFRAFWNSKRAQSAARRNRLFNTFKPGHIE